MKKHLLKLLLLCCIGILACSLFACVPTTEQYKVDFIVDGRVYDSCTTSGNSRVVLPSDPTKTNYIFKGWYFDEGEWTKEFDAHSLEKEPIKKDINVYAKFDIDASHTCNKQWRVEIPATCQTEGRRVLKCTYSGCNKVYAVETIPVSTVHSSVEKTKIETVKPATCVEDGYCTIMYYCSLCESKLREENNVKIDKDINAHNFANGKLVKDGENFNFEATCINEDCGFSVNLKNVDVTENVIIAATCVSDGQTSYKYSAYGLEFEIKVDTLAAGHMLCGVAIEDKKVYSEQTHSFLFSKIQLIADDTKTCKDGQDTIRGVYTCDTCGEIEYITVIKPHVGTWVKTTDATCYKVGEEVLAYCSACEGTNLKREIPITDSHKAGETILVKEGTKFHLATACANRTLGCEHYDVMVKDVEVTVEEIHTNDCKVDDKIVYTHTAASGKYTYSEVLSTGHIFNGVRAESLQSPEGWFDYTYLDKGLLLFEGRVLECDKPSLIAYYVCESCNIPVDVYVYRPHSGSWLTTKAPTCSKEGVANFYCDLCDYGDDNSVTKVIEPLEHKYDFELLIKADNNFYLEGKCVCGQESTPVQVAVTASIIKAPTCKQTGEIIYTCNYDGGVYQKTDIIDKTPHTLDVELIRDGARIDFAQYAKYIETGWITLDVSKLCCVNSKDDTSKDVSGYYTCTECGEQAKVNVYRLHTGEWDVYYDTNTSPCVVTGTKQLICEYDGCGYKSEKILLEPQINHNYTANLVHEKDGTFTINAECNVVGCGDKKTFDKLETVTTRVILQATCSTMGLVKYTFSYEGEEFTLDAAIDKGNHVLNGVDYKTLYVGEKLPSDITDFVIVGSGEDYYFECEECGNLVRVDVIK